MPKFPAKPAWESLKMIGRPVGVDRKAGVLRGYVVAQAGPFKSNGRGEFDEASLSTIVELMGASSNGTRSRFTHPDMSNDGLGKHLGRARDPILSTALDQRTGKQVAAVRADLHFDKTALDTPIEGGKPLGLYVMDLAESDPDAISSSLVLRVDEEYRLRPDGTPMTDEEGNHLPPLWRPKEIRATDIVDTGDAVDGLLSADSIDGLPLASLWRGAEMLDSVFAGQSREVTEARLSDYVQRYLSRRYGDLAAASGDVGRIAAVDADIVSRRRKLALKMRQSP
jgi:hypothetical protein